MCKSQRSWMILSIMYIGDGAWGYLKPSELLFVGAPSIRIDLIRKEWIAFDNIIRKHGEYDNIS